MSAATSPGALPLRRRDAWSWLAVTELARTKLLDILEAGLLVALVVLSAWPYRSFYATGAIVASAASSAIVVTAAVVVTARARWWVAGLFGVPVAIVTAGYLLYPASRVGGLPGPRTVSQAFGGLTDGWAQMLTVALPADAHGTLALTPVVLTGIGTLAALQTCLRTRVVLLPLAAPMTCFVVSLIFTAATHRTHLGATRLLLVGMLLFALLRTNRLAAASDEGISTEGAAAVGVDLTHRRWRSTAGRVSFGLPVVAGVSLLGVAAASALPLATGAARFDPRNFRQQSLQIPTSVSPLAALKSQLSTKPPTRLFSVALIQPSDPAHRVDRIRVAALDQYNGSLWSSSSTFVRAGSVLPAEQTSTGSVVVAEHIEIADLPPPYLPVAGRPTNIDASLVIGFDAASGVLVTDRKSLKGARYSLRADVVPVGDQLGNLQAAIGPATALELPDRPPWLTEALGVAGVSGTSGTLAQLKRLEQFLRNQPYDASTPTGHSYFRLRQLLVGHDPGDNRGYAEQRASAFTILARAMGVPARVAVGYLLKPAQAGVFTVTTDDASAWPEVNVRGLGWVAFEPTSRAGQLPPVKPKDGGKSAGSTNSQRLAPDNDVPPVIFHSPDPQASERLGVVGTIRRAGFVAAGGLAVLLVLIVSCVLLKALRRKRRRTVGTASHRLLGAWRETTDRLRERGLALSAASTANETARRAEERMPTHVVVAVSEMTPLVSAALYAPMEPADEDVARAWSLEQRVRHDLTRSGSLTTRLRALVDPRPLVPRAPLVRRAVRAPGESGKRRATS